MYAYFLLTALALLLAHFEGRPPAFSLFAPNLARSGIASLAGSFVYGVCGTLLVRSFFGADPKPGEILARSGRFLRWTQLYRALALPLYAVQLYLLGWDVSLARWDAFGRMPGAARSAALLAPFFLSLAAGWAAYYRVHQAMRPQMPGLLSYFSFQVRQYLTAVAGIFILLVLLDLLERSASGPIDRFLRKHPDAEGLLLWGVYASLLTLAYFLMPLFLRMIWKARPLPPGEIQERLERLCAQADFGTRQVMVWETQFALLNACTVGLVPQLRYILITDALLENLQPEEVEAVFAHELGHVRARHFLLYLLYTLTAMAVVLLVEPFLTNPRGNFWAYLAQWGVVMGAVWGLFFGFLSRRFERQADLLGAAQVGSTPRMQAALQRIAELSGQPSRLRTLTHGSIQDRIDYLAKASSNPIWARRIHRSVLWITVAMAVILGVSLFLLWVVR